MTYKEKKAEDVQVTYSETYGVLAQGYCPKCKMDVFAGQRGTGEETCHCGYKWKLHIELKSTQSYDKD